jgi:radical SAM protein with 4Fe4S-binding SPASM domain
LSTLDSLVKKYRDNGVSVSINSNITLLKPEHIDFLKKYQLGVLTSVISSNEKEFDNVTLKPGSFKRFCNNLEELSKQNIYVSANMVVDKTRINQVYDTGKLVASLGAKGFCGTRMSPSNNGVLNDYATRILDKNDMSLLFDQLLTVEKDFGLTVSSLNSIPFCCVDNPEKYSALLTRSCNAGQTGAGMSANGDLRLCQHFDINTGNVLQTPLKELWNLMPSWKQEYISNSSCNFCAESQRCGGGCRENAYKLDNDLFGEDSLKRAPLKQKIKDKYLDKIESIQFNSGVKCREEDFGAILFRGSGAYAIVDGFTYAITKNLYSRPVISTKDILEIG